MGPLSVCTRPSSIKHDRDRGAASTGGKCLVNVHAKSCLIPETSTDTPVRKQGPGGSLPGPDAGHPLHGAGDHGLPTVARTEDGVPVACPIGRSTPGTCGYSRTARYTASPASRQAGPLRKPPSKLGVTPPKVGA
jgi:hypothetical protein